MREDERSLKEKTHEMPFKSWSGNFRWLASRENFASISLASFTHEPVAKLSVQSWKTRELESLTHDWAYKWNKSQKHQKKKKCFSHKNNLKNMGDTNHFQKQTKRTKIFLVWSIYGWAHTHHIWSCTITQMI